MTAMFLLHFEKTAMLHNVARSCCETPFVTLDFGHRYRYRDRHLDLAARLDTPQCSGGISSPGCPQSCGRWAAGVAANVGLEVKKKADYIISLYLFAELFNQSIYLDFKRGMF